MICHMKAELLFKDKFIYADGAIREMKLWRLPAADADVERPHGLKYSLYYGNDGVRIIGYDNERGKGDHRHYREREGKYEFESVERLIQDFRDDVAKERGNVDEGK